jgi:NTP pyrophosphatase (non-canonical NTP hydrolase)
LTIHEFQKLIEELYYERDADRGIGLSFAWFVEEVGELARHVVRPGGEGLAGEFADVFAWLATLASLSRVDLEAAVAAKYAAGCPRCNGKPCSCP